MPRIILSALACLFLLCSCMTIEEVTSVYIASNGSIEMVRFLDNVRSNKDGAEGTREQEGWLADFRRNEISEIKSLKEAGATHIKAVLLKDQAPFSAVISASFRSVNQFGKAFDLNTKKSKNKVIFKKMGKRRSLVFKIYPGKLKGEKESKKSGDKTKSTYPIFKFIPQNGTITKSNGFTIDGSGSAATLDFAEISMLDQKGKPYKVFIEWNVHSS
jgi:hypothetical protein